MNDYLKQDKKKERKKKLERAVIILLILLIAILSYILYEKTQINPANIKNPIKTLIDIKILSLIFSSFISLIRFLDRFIELFYFD